MATIEQRNNFTIKKPIEIFGPNGKLIKFKIKKLYNEDNELVTVANHAKELLHFEIKQELTNLDMIRQSK